MVQQAKIETVRETVDRLERSQAVVLVKYQGLTVAQLSELRKQLREVSGELKVVKNRLTQRALQETGCEALDDLLAGPTAVVFGFGEPTGPAKVCSKYAKDVEHLQVLGGLLDKKRISAAKVAALAKLPGRTELLSMMASTMKAPARQMATAMNQAMAKIVYAMKARVDQLGEA
jgi:large subunit ribosomal protein L10